MGQLPRGIKLDRRCFALDLEAGLGQVKGVGGWNSNINYDVRS